MDTMIFYLIFIAVLFIILFFVVMSAINNSKVAGDLEEIKNILRAIHKKSSGIIDEAPDKTVILDTPPGKCPACGSDVNDTDEKCGTCGLKLE